MTGNFFVAHEFIPTWDNPILALRQGMPASLHGGAGMSWFRRLLVHF
jgi:hypothetical protein